MRWACSSPSAICRASRAAVAGGHRPLLGDQAADGLALDVLHDQEVAAVGLAEVVDPDEVLVLELGADPRLALEPRDRPRVVHPLGRQDLQRHEAAQPRVAGQVDPAHPAVADQVQQQVAIDPEAAGAAGQQLLRLPERELALLDRLPRQPAIEVLRRLALLRRDRLPAGGQGPATSIRPL